jgi:hypothetical protein
VLLYFGVIGAVGWCVVRVRAAFFPQVNNHTNIISTHQQHTHAVGRSTRC